MIPLGFEAVAVLYQYRSAALHFVFLGGFATLVFGISIHVVVSHSDATDSALLNARPWPAVLAGVLLGAALGFRFLVECDRPHVMTWLAFASGSFLIATIAWGILVLPRALRGTAGRETDSAAADASRPGVLHYETVTPRYQTGVEEQ